MNKRKKALLGLFATIAPLSIVSVPTEVNAETQATINSYWLSNVNDSGFTINIKLNNGANVPKIYVPVWRSGFYREGMQGYIATKNTDGNYSCNVKYANIGNGSDYIYFGIHPYYSDGSNRYFLKDVCLKIDQTAPELSVTPSTTAWTNQNIKLNIKSTDNFNIVSNIKAVNTGKNSTLLNKELHSKPKVLVLADPKVKSYNWSTYSALVSNGYDVTYKSTLENIVVNDLLGYDVVVVDAYCWGISDTITNLLNQAFEKGVSIHTVGNDTFLGLPLATYDNGGHKSYRLNTYTNNVTDSYYSQGRSDRISPKLDGRVEVDSNVFISEVKSGTSVFMTSTDTDTGVVAPSGLYKTGTLGNKWIHTQKMYYNGFDTILDEILSGTDKTRQSYSETLTISENGSYDISITDFYGNSTTKTVKISNIDKLAPYFSSISYDKSYAPSVTATLTAKDNGDSGIDYIVLPNGSKVTGSTATYKFTDNGTYKFTVYDKAGNSKVETITINNIDKTVNPVSNITCSTEYVANNTRNLKLTFPNINDVSGIKGYSYIIDKSPSTVPGNTINLTTNSITKQITDTGVYYLHIKAFDNAGNVSSVTHYKIDIPTLTAKSMDSENYIRLDWNLNDTNGKTYKVYQKKEGATEFQSIGATDFNSSKQVNVLNVYPGNGDNVTFTTWDGETCTLPKSASLKSWMETPNSENSKGYGKGIIEVTPVSITEFNANPDKYLKNSDGTYKYDVVMFGSWDSNGGSSDLTTLSMEATKEYIESGRGVLFGHDTLRSSMPNFYKLFSYANIGAYVAPAYNGINEIADGTGYADKSYISNIEIKKKGLLTNYPWNIGEVGTQLKIPSSHNSQLAYGTIWARYIHPSYTSADMVAPGNFYLTTWNNTAMIQTGHANGSATADEQKVLANTLFYLNQLATDTYLDDKSGQDLKAPNTPTISNLTYTSDGYATFNIDNVTDNGSTYEYYVQAEDKDGATTISNLASTTITSGIKGYSYVIDGNPDTQVDDSVDITSGTKIKIKNNSNSKYIHIKSIDNAGNASNTVHYKIADTTAPKLKLEVSTKDWTNQNITITATASDDQSGVKSIILPNGNIVNGTTATFSVSKNGVYYFKSVDNVGNEIISSIIINNIDKDKPTVIINNNYNDTWTNKDVQITITSTN